MRSRYIVVAALVLLFVMVLAGAAFGRASEVVAYRQARDNSTISATITISMYLPFVTTNTDIFFDDFSDPSSGWPIDDSENVKRSYQDDEYELLVRPKNFWGGSVPPLVDISSYTVDAEMRIPNGGAGYYGLVFDRVDWNHFYVYVVSPRNQYYAVFRHDPAWVLLTPFTQSSAIKSGSTTNHLRVDRNGDEISVYVNEQYLTSLTDAKYSSSSNEVGLFAQSSTDVPVAMRFDNFEVRFLDINADRNSTSLVENPTNFPAEGQGFFLLEP
jgi:hypothetical protein